LTATRVLPSSPPRAVPTRPEGVPETRIGAGTFCQLDVASDRVVGHLHFHLPQSPSSGGNDDRRGLFGEL